MVLLFLSFGSLWDLKKKTIPTIYLVVYGFVGIVYSVFGLFGEKNIWEIVLAVVPGCIGVILSFVTREQIGMGDGLVILCTGFFLSCRHIMAMICMAFAILTVVAIVLLITRRVNCKTRIPFIPFLLVGFIVFVLGEVL